MANGNEFREYMKIVNRTSGTFPESHLSEEQMLVYCRGEMSETQRESAQAHILNCEQCIALFRNARDFLEPEREDDEEITAAETSEAWQSLWAKARMEASRVVPGPTRILPRSFERPKEGRSYSRLTQAMAAVLLISFGGFGWQTWRLSQERQQRRQSEEVAARLESNRRELEQQVSQLQQSESDELRQEQERSRAAETERDQLLARLNTGQQSAPELPEFFARLSSERGAEDDIRLHFTGATKAARLKLIIAKPYEFRRYAIELSDAGGNVVSNASGLRPKGNDGALRFRVNRSAFRPGKYTLRLYGVQGKTRQHLGDHDVLVTVER